VRIELGTHIDMPLGQGLPDPVLERILDDLTIPNPEREKAQRLDTWGWEDLPKKIRMYDIQSGWIRIPRGYLSRLFKRFAEGGVKVEINDMRSFAKARYSRERRSELRPQQGPAVEAILKHQQGIVQAPPGSGKTITALEAIRQSQRKGIVLVNTTNIASQWVDRCEFFLGFRPGIVGDGEWNDSEDITIALVQTLASRADYLTQDGWFDQFGFLAADEMHHTPALTWLDVIERFRAQYRVGYSATPNREDGRLDVSKAYLGEIVNRVTKQELRHSGFLVQAKVRMIETGFSHPFWGVHYAELRKDMDTDVGWWECQVPGCKKGDRRHKHQTNYQTVLKELVADADRRKVIVDCILGERNHAQLVLSKRLSHLEALRQDCLETYEWPEEQLMMLTGQEKTKERDRVARMAGNGFCVVFSTIADEALDVPRLDRIHLAWPTKNGAIIEQQVGRVERAHPEKRDAVVFDYVDDVAAMRAQWRERLGKVYKPQEMEVEREAADDEPGHGYWGAEA
jgi:superfamily II DNA or RNA helicase